MAIRNTNLGGSDWSDGEVLYSADLNDTFDAAYTLVDDKLFFWQSSSYRTTYDEFTADLNAARWDTAAATGSVAWSNTSNAGGTAGEAFFYPTGGSSGNAYMVSNALPQNKKAYHLIGYANMQMGAGGQGNRTWTLYFRDGDGTDTAINVWANANDGTNYFYFDITAINTSTDTYDIYCGGKKIISDLVPVGDFEMGIKTGYSSLYSNADNWCKIYIDNVYYTLT